MELEEIAAEIDKDSKDDAVEPEDSTQDSTIEKEEPEKTVEDDSTTKTEVKEDTVPSTEDVDDPAQLKARIEELEKINNGLLQAKTSAVKKRETIETKKNEEVSALKAELEELKASATKVEEVDEDDEIDGIPVEFDDDGNAFIKSGPQQKAIERKIKALELKIEQAEQKATQATQELAMTKEEAAQAENLNSFLNEKKGYKEVFPEVLEQWQYVKNEIFDQYIEANQITPPQSKEEALSIAMSDGFQKVFKTKYPTGDLESVVQAGLYGGRFYERKALDIVLEKKTTSSHTPLPKDKPQSLNTISGGEDQGDEGLLAKAADMSLEDFMKLSPEEEARIDRLLEKG